jgi:hypothetical protein
MDGAQAIYIYIYIYIYIIIWVILWIRLIYLIKKNIYILLNCILVENNLNCIEDDPICLN